VVSNCSSGSFLYVKEKYDLITEAVVGIGSIDTSLLSASGLEANLPFFASQKLLQRISDRNALAFRQRRRVQAIEDYRLRLPSQKRAIASSHQFLLERLEGRLLIQRRMRHERQGLASCGGYRTMERARVRVIGHATGQPHVTPRVTCRPN